MFSNSLKKIHPRLKQSPVKKAYIGHNQQSTEKNDRSLTWPVKHYECSGKKIILYALHLFKAEIDCKTVRILAYSSTREQSKKGSGATLTLFLCYAKPILRQNLTVLQSKAELTLKIVRYIHVLYKGCTEFSSSSSLGLCLVSLFTDPLFSLQSPSSARDKK